jgi:hypothetical protein
MKECEEKIQQDTPDPCSALLSLGNNTMQRLCESWLHSVVPRVMNTQKRESRLQVFRASPQVNSKPSQGRLSFLCKQTYNTFTALV